MSNVSETDKFIVRSVNSGPMGPQGPVKKNVAIMNNESGIKYPARRYNLMNFMTAEEMEKTDLSEELLAGIPNDKMPSSETEEDDTTSVTDDTSSSKHDDTTVDDDLDDMTTSSPPVIDLDRPVDDEF